MQIRCPAALQVICTKSKPNCSACPLQSQCEYACSGGERWQGHAGETWAAERLPAQTEGSNSSGPQAVEDLHAVESPFTREHAPQSLEQLIADVLHSGLSLDPWKALSKSLTSEGLTSSAASAHGLR